LGRRSHLAGLLKELGNRAVIFGRELATLVTAKAFIRTFRPVELSKKIAGLALIALLILSLVIAINS
jgi:hypothetical protein